MAPMAATTEAQVAGPARRVVCAALIALAVLALASGCGDDRRDGATATPPVATTAVGASAPAAAQNQADIEFAQDMITRHQQAVRMAELADRRAGDPRVTALAARIRAARAPEIRQLTTWLTEWGVPVSAPSAGTGSGADGGAQGRADGGADSGGPGSEPDRDMTALAGAAGADFDRMFLELMVRHHEDALRAAGIEVRQGRHPGAKALAGRIRADQTAELSQLRNLLSGIGR